jgi:FemAB-related protein (PEP-CTERM system-associated)
MDGSGSAVVVRPFQTGDAGRWDAFVRASAAGTFFHLSRWSRVIERAFGHRTHYLVAERGGVVTGVLPLTHVRSTLFGASLISNAFAVSGGPLAADEESQHALDTEATRLMAELGVPTLEMRNKADRPGWHTRSGLYATFAKTILPSPDANLKAVPRKQRAMIRKGIQNGLRSEVDADVERLYCIYAESVRNLGTPVFAKSYFRILHEEFSGCCDVITITAAGRGVATVLSFYFRDQVLPFYGGGVRAARRLAANDFMYWEVMRRACERGYRVFDFGRSKTGTGAYAFKRNWGFSPTPLDYQFLVTAGRRAPELNPLNPKFRLLVAGWKRLPLPLANRIGPMIVKGLG